MEEAVVRRDDHHLTRRPIEADAPRVRKAGDHVAGPRGGGAADGTARRAPVLADAPLRDGAGRRPVQPKGIPFLVHARDAAARADPRAAPRSLKTARCRDHVPMPGHVAREGRP
ncbi:hypothetical protein VQ02_14780 [Methylobacterium variabile]|jgi:hypothetical protein|uniref:Uncharacterized protein n=1 Tax=Methylobacterium variabile TaxID=298794 RepID=A0A0J6ST00_9HYPH|nr:hypothetical protein VQ02_14780 [Methylobacterium variabile]